MAAKAHSEVGRRGGRRKTAAASNEERNLKKEMLAAMATIGYVLAILFIKVICNLFRCEDGDLQVHTRPLSL